ncbi:MAG: GHKL domain-containing protein [Clostridiales bacterium]|nr:GHKL domain-containing protein [Clostridiales bacterium]
MTIVICSECILYVSDNVGNVLPFLITIMVSMIVITLFTWYMVTKISRANKIKTEMLLMQKQTELYEKSILETNEQIQKFAQSKHEMNKALLLIRGLLNEKDYKGIYDYCENKSSEIMDLHTLINTDNPSLNAVINVEASKAIQHGITLIANIYDSMKEIEKSDLMSIIGNMCDNAIEYLARNENIANRCIRIEAFKSYNMYTIKCKNMISGSVLANNPELLTTKDDANNHGLGISIIKDIVNKYSGQIEIKEDEEYFITTALLMAP